MVNNVQVPLFCDESQDSFLWLVGLGYLLLQYQMVCFSPPRITIYTFTTSTRLAFDDEEQGAFFLSSTDLKH